MLVADEIEHGQAGLSFRPPQSPTELLQKDGGRFSRTQKEHGVEFWDVHALVEQIDREDHIDVAIAEVAQSRYPLVGRRVAGDGNGADPSVVETASHPRGVSNAHTEPQGPHPFRVSHDPANGVEDL